MTTSTSQEGFLPSHYRSKQEFLASLPPWRRLLSNLNWHPTIDKKVERYAIEQRLLRLRKEDEQLRKEDERLRNESEQRQNEELQREIEHEQRMQQLEKEDERLEEEDEQLRKEDEQLRKEDARLAELDRRMSELDAKIAALWPSSTTSSPQAPPPESDSPT
jgi:DNA repair exonuclease SbcCD ATPase subunit